MEIIDISQELFGCAVYPGDPAPEREILQEIRRGDVCNLTALKMCAHNGTHVDAPYHFYADGRTVDALPLEKLIGYVYVADHEGELGAADAERILRAAEACSPEAARRILIRGNAVLTEAGAKVFAGAGIALFGNESQTVGPENAPMQVHRIMLGAEVVLLEGIRLAQAEEGVWFLHAAPLNLGGADGAPCRATLLRE